MTQRENTQLSQAEFLEIYGEEAFSKGKFGMTVNQAIVAENEYCEGDPSKRMEESARLAFLAKTGRRCASARAPLFASANS